MILLALGSNLGQRERTLQRARDALAASGVAIVAASSLHETPALVPEGAPPDWNRPYLNQVLQVRTALAPLRAAGLREVDRNAARTTARLALGATRDRHRHPGPRRSGAGRGDAGAAARPDAPAALRAGAVVRDRAAVAASAAGPHRGAAAGRAAGRRLPHEATHRDGHPEPHARLVFRRRPTRQRRRRRRRAPGRRGRGHAGHRRRIDATERHWRWTATPSGSVWPRCSRSWHAGPGVAACA